MTRNTEEQFHLAVAEYLDRILMPDTVWFHSPLGGNRHIAEAAKLRRFGARAGLPDICIIHKGRALFIELKAITGRLSLVQTLMNKRLQDAGAGVAVCTTIEGVGEVLRNHRVPTRLA